MITKYNMKYGILKTGVAMINLDKKVFLSIVISITAIYCWGTDYIEKKSTEYGNMCGCKNIFFVKHFESPEATLGDFAPNSNRDNVVAFGGTAASNKIITPEDGGYSELVIPNDIVSCFMDGRLSRLTGYFKTEKGKFVEIAGEYTVSGTVYKIPSLRPIGITGWKKFDFYFDFLDVETTPTSVKLLAKSPNNEIPLNIDEIRICTFCDGTIQGDGPELEGLTITPGDWNRVFKSDDFYYTINVDESVSEVSVTAEVTGSPLPSLKIGGVTSTSGTPVIINIEEQGETAPIDINVYNTICEQNTYLVTIVREVNADAYLADLQVTNGVLTPSFYKFETEYLNTVPPDINTISITPVASDPEATITVNGIPVKTGTASQDIDISINPEIIIIVTAKDGTTTKTYTVNNAKTIIFVKTTGNDENDGLSWDNAKETIEEAVALAKTLSPSADHPISIWVAAGRYFPLPVETQITPVVLEPYINIYGGFPTNGGNWEDRSVDRLTNITTIDADVDHDNDDATWDQDVENNDESVTGNLHGVIIASSNSTIDGFVFTHGYGDYTTWSSGGTGGGAYQFGGAVTISTGSSTRIQNCTFIRNCSNYFGGAIYASQSDVALKNVIFENNQSRQDGGAIKLDGTNVTINSCSFINNKSFEYNGGSIYCTGDLLVVNDCNLNGNVSSAKDNNDGKKGGAIYSASSNTRINNSIFFNNKTGNDENNGSGGAIYASGENVEVLNSQFYNNIAGDDETATLSYGGAIYSSAEESNFKNNVFFANRARYGASVVMQYQIATQNFINCLFIKNEAYLGGGIFFLADQGENGLGASLKVINCTFAANTSNSGDALFVYYFHDEEQMALPEIINSIIWYTQIGNPYGAILSDITIPLSNNNWIQNYQNQPDVNNPQFNITDMNLIQDKDDILGSDGSVSADDAFMLGGSSPCLGAGQGSDNTTFLDFFRIENSSPIDITSSPRIAGDPLLIDIGAYEAQ